MDPQHTRHLRRGCHAALREQQDIRLHQQREADVRPRPGSRHGLHPMRGALHPRQPRVQQRLMLEEVQMPPGVFSAVIRSADVLVARRARKLAAGRKIQPDVQLLGFAAKLDPRHRPRRLQPQRDSKQFFDLHVACAPRPQRYTSGDLNGG